MNSAISPNQSVSRFVDNNDGSVTDNNSGLQWTKATITKKCVTHARAEKACADLGEGWRLPTVEELFLLADRSRKEQAIDTDAFPDTKSDWYWTSTISAWSSDLAWFVNFSYGSASVGHRGYDGALVRAVRSVAPGQ